MIICPASPRNLNQRSPWADRPLVYAERLDIVSVEPSSGLHVLRRATRRAARASDSESRVPLGEIFPLDQLRSYCHVTPRLGQAADVRLSQYNSIHVSSTMLLNKYYDKDFYYVVTCSEL